MERGTVERERGSERVESLLQKRIDEMASMGECCHSSLRYNVQQIFDVSG